MSPLYGVIIKQGRRKEINYALFKWLKSMKPLESHILPCEGHSLTFSGCMGHFL